MGGSVTKYEKKDNNACKKTTIQKRVNKSLTSLWNKDMDLRYGDTYFKLVRRNKTKDNFEAQEWKMVEPDEEGTFTWTWLMDYDKHNGHAIPVKYTFLLDACEDYRRRELHFTYQPL